jgi:hypothetical protein
MDCLVQSTALNKINKYFDGQWQGMMAASDGNCYFGSSTHSPNHGSTFFKFDPKEQQLTILAEDMTKICGEDLSKTPPQGKIHSPIVECDGWLYFTTHLSNYWEEAINQYTGAHVIGYELSTGKFRDFGVVRKGYTIYSAINVDRQNKKLYVFSVPFSTHDIAHDSSHLYQIDMHTGNKTDLGAVPDKERCACFWLFIDDKGNCWFSVWKKFNPALYANKEDLYCFDPNTKKIKRFKNVLPVGQLAPDGEPAPEDLKPERSWTWVEAIQGNKQCLFSMGCFGGGDERLWIFDPDKNIENGEAFQSLGYIGSTFLSIACNHERAFFIQYEDLSDTRDYCTEFIRDTDPKDIHFNDVLHLRSIAIKPNMDREIIDHGKIIDQEGRHLSMVMSMAADNEGNVFMNGSWDSLSEEESSRQYVWQGLKDAYADICDTYKNAEVGKHKLMPRGQFFSHVHVAKDKK